MIQTPELQKAIQHHQMGQRELAKPIYLSILARDPYHPEANHFLGMLEHEIGNHAAGLDYLHRSVSLKPNEAFFYSNLANTLKDLGQTDDAIQAFRRAIAIDSSFYVAHYNLGRLYLELGRWPEAKMEFERSVAILPSFAEGWNNLGVSLMNMGELDRAKECFQRATNLRPDYVEAFFHMADCHGRRQQWAESRKALETVLRMRPAFPEALNNLGMVLHQQGDREQAKRCFQQALNINRQFLDPYHHLGQLALEEGRQEEAIAWHERAFQINPDDPNNHFSLGNVLNTMGRLREAAHHYSQAVAKRPGFHQALNNLGNVLMSLNANDDARQAFQRAILVKPDFSDAFANLGNLEKEQGLPDVAEQAMLEAIRLKPDFAAAYSNLGNVYFDQGRIEDAINSFRKGIELKQDEGDFVSNYLFCLNYVPGLPEEEIFREHYRLGREKFDELRETKFKFNNSREPGRKLKIGYVTPDFWTHPVGRFMLPILRNHDRAKYDVSVYYLRYLKDPITHACMKHVDTWRDSYSVSDEELARQIYDDKIDILVDLIMHSRDCRPRLFARKPAPVQVSYLAYAGVTGISAIDYRITDRFIDEPGRDYYGFPEKPLHLPHCWWCFEPPTGVPIPEVVPPPCLKNGSVTFGSLSNFGKMHPHTRGTWAEILKRVPNSRLIIHVKEGRHRKMVEEFFATQGVSTDRLQMIGYQSTLEYMRTYESIDIALDTFPYAGGTTTCDALWMGVPVVTFAGDRLASRGGLSILSTIGRPEWVATSREGYIEKAIELANDPDRLASIRSGLRDQMRSSPLMDAVGFTKDLESIYRDAWKSYCASPTA